MRLEGKKMSALILSQAAYCNETTNNIFDFCAFSVAVASRIIFH